LRRFGVGDVLRNSFTVSCRGRAECRVADLLQAFDNRLPKGPIVATSVHQYERV
jgi:hypothetical protein